jgi:endonuclease YncB( thermonuclease family)
MTRWVVGLILLCLAGCAPALPFPDMEPGETGRVVRVIDGDALVLDTGQTVRLVSIEAPAMYRRSEDPAPHAGESTRLLEDLALGRRVRLYYPGITRDRYDRALAHVMTIDGTGPTLWLNYEMVARGGAWVRLYPSTAQSGQALLEAEAIARAERLGLWALAAYRPVDAAGLSEKIQGFRIVSGTLGERLTIDPDQRYAPACRRALEGAALTLSVRRAAASTCGLSSGRAVTLRGYVSDGTLDLSHPWHLELGVAD